MDITKYRTDTQKDAKEFDKNISEWLIETKTARFGYCRKYFLNILKTFNLKGKKVLELGCGLSPFLPQMRDSKNYGLNNSKKLIKLNNPKDGRFIAGDMLQCSQYFNQKFDFVFMSGVIHHLNPADHRLALQEINKVMKNKGLLLFCEPNMRSVTGIYYLTRKLIEGLFGRDFLFKLVGFSSEDEKYLFPGKFIKTLNKNGFKVKKMSSIQILRLPPLKKFRKFNIEWANNVIDKIFGRLNFGTVLIIICQKNKECTSQKF